MHSLLLVEDDRNIANIYKTKLEFKGYEVHHSINGLEALHYVKENTPELILLDLLMPIMTGEQFLQKIRKQHLCDGTPILVLTNVSREEAPNTLWHLGISGYFIKANHTPTELVTIIEKLMLET